MEILKLVLKSENLHETMMFYQKHWVLSYFSKIKMSSDSG